MKKTSIILIAGFLSACAKNAPMTQVEWSKGSRQTVPKEVSTAGFKTSESVNTKFQRVELAEQRVGQSYIEGSYLKKVYSTNGDLIFLSANFSEKTPHLREGLVESMEIQKAHLIQDLKDRYNELARYNLSEPKVFIDSKGAKPIAYWKLQYFDHQGIPWELKIDPDLNIQSTKRVGSQFHETLAMVFPKGPRLSDLQDVLLKNLISEAALDSNRVLVKTEGKNQISSVKDALNFNPGDERFDQVQVFYFVNQALDWFSSQLGITIPRKLDVVVHVGAPNKTNTAFYYNGNIRIGSGDDISYAKIPQDPSIVMHETCHSLVDSLARLPFDGEGGSLNEGFADFFTAAQLNNPNMGEVAFLKGPYRRTLENNFNVGSKNGGLYHDSGIVSGTLWDIRRNLGAPKAIEIALKVLNQLNPSSDLNDFGKKIEAVLSETTSGKDLETGRNVLKNRGWIN